MLYRGLIFQILNSIFFVMCSYGTHFFLGKNMTPAEYGIWGTILVILDFEYLFVNNGVRQNVAREIAGGQYDVKDIIRKSLFLQIILAGSLSLATYHLAPYLSVILHESSLKGYIQVAAFIVPITGFYIVTQGVHNGLFLLEQEAKIGILYSILKLSIIPFVLLAQFSLVVSAEIGFMFAAAGGLFFGSISLIKRKKLIVKRAKKINMIYFAKNSISYSLFFIVVSVTLSIDTIFLRIFIKNPEEIGYYTGAVNFAKITYYVLTAFFLVVLPIVSDLYEKRDFAKIKENILQLLLLINVFVVPIPILLISSRKHLLVLFYNEKYSIASGALVLLALSNFFMGIIVIFNMIAKAMEKKKFSSVISICMIMLDVVLICILTPKIGMIGTALASCCCTFIFALISVIYIRIQIGSFMDKKLCVSFVLPFFFLCCTSFLFRRIDIGNIFVLFVVYTLLYALVILCGCIFKIIDIKLIYGRIKNNDKKDT